MVWVQATLVYQRKTCLNTTKIHKAMSLLPFITYLNLSLLIGCLRGADMDRLETLALAFKRKLFCVKYAPFLRCLIYKIGGTFVKVAWKKYFCSWIFVSRHNNKSFTEQALWSISGKNPTWIETTLVTMTWGRERLKKAFTLSVLVAKK